MGEVISVTEKTFRQVFNRTTLFDLSKCFLGNRGNFCPYQQALRHKKIMTGNTLKTIQQFVILKQNCSSFFQQYLPSKEILSMLTTTMKMMNQALF